MCLAPGEPVCGEAPPREEWGFARNGGDRRRPDHGPPLRACCSGPRSPARAVDTRPRARAEKRGRGWVDPAAVALAALRAPQAGQAATLQVAPRLWEAPAVQLGPAMVRAGARGATRRAAQGARAARAARPEVGARPPVPRGSRPVAGARRRPATSSTWPPTATTATPEPRTNPSSPWLPRRPRFARTRTGAPSPSRSSSAAERTTSARPSPSPRLTRELRRRPSPTPGAAPPPRSVGACRSTA